MRVGLSLTIPGLSAGEIIEAAVAADDAGADLVTFGEAAFDPLALGAAAARRVSSPLAAGIARWDREPEAMARAATTVADLAGESYRLGIGPGPVRGDSAGILPRFGNYLRRVRKALGERDDITVEIAAARPGMARLAGAEADGVLLSRVHTVERLRDVMLPAVRSGEGGGPRISRAILVRCAVAPTEAEGVEMIRRTVVGYELPLIADLVTEPGVLAEAIDHRVAGQLDAAAAAVPETIVRRMALVGPPESCLDQIRRYSGLVDLVSLFPCGATPRRAVSGTLDLVRLTRKSEV